MANHRAAGRAQVRPLHTAKGTRRNSEVATASAVKVGVIGALATATIAVPVASAVADQGAALPSSIEASGQSTSVAEVTSVQAAPAAPAAQAVPAAQQLPAASSVETQDQYTDANDLGDIVANEATTVVDANGNEVTLAAAGEWQVPQPGARISSPFGMRIHPVLGYRKMHNGVDYAAACGTPTMAANSGKVVFAGRKSGGGNTVILDHGNGTRTHYLHFSAISVNVGDTVEKGQVVGKVGTTGISTGCHLHFGLEQNGEYVNPLSLWK